MTTRVCLLELNLNRLKMNLLVLVLCIVLVLLDLDCSHAKGMWGARRKRDNDAVHESTNFEASRRRASRVSELYTNMDSNSNVESSSFSQKKRFGTLESNSWSELEQHLNTIIEGLEKVFQVRRFRLTRHPRAPPEAARSCPPGDSRAGRRG